jgi:hypothetical protein
MKKQNEEPQSKGPPPTREINKQSHDPENTPNDVVIKEDPL